LREQRNDKDLAPILAEIRNNNIAPRINLPKVLIKANFNYSVNLFKVLAKDRILYSKYYFLPYIYKENEIHFQLSDGLNKLKLPDLLNKPVKEVTLDLVNQLPFRVDDFVLIDNYFYVKLSARKNYQLKENRMKTLIQKYDMSGNFIDESIFEYSDNIRKIAKIENKLHLIIIDGENWRIKGIDL
jgi:hypothetical protein